MWSGYLDVSRNDAVEGLAVAQQQAAGVVEAFATAGKRRLIRAGADGDTAAEEGMVTVILGKDGREGVFAPA